MYPLHPDDREAMTLRLHEMEMAATVIEYGKQLFRTKDGQERFERWLENRQEEGAQCKTSTRQSHGPQPVPLSPLPCG